MTNLAIDRYSVQRTFTYTHKSHVENSTDISLTDKANKCTKSKQSDRQLKIATWNVRAISNKEEEVINELNTGRIDIGIVQIRNIKESQGL